MKPLHDVFVDEDPVPTYLRRRQHTFTGEAAKVAFGAVEFLSASCYVEDVKVTHV